MLTLTYRFSKNYGFLDLKGDITRLGALSLLRIEIKGVVMR